MPIVDEHYYERPEWFLANGSRYDGYDRAKSKVYLGEYASRGNTLFNALAEAAYMTSLERNGDVVHMASYAPLLAKVGHTQWNPDLIYFTNEGVFPTVNYYVQGLFGRNSGDRWLPSKIDPATEDLAVSAVRDSKSGDLILKLVNTSHEPKSLRIALDGATKLPASAAATVLAGDPGAKNDVGTAPAVTPKTTPLAVGPTFAYDAPASSLTVIRIPPIDSMKLLHLLAIVSLAASSSLRGADPLAWTNPIVPHRADPQVLLHDGWYYLAATVPEYDRIELRRARTLGDLSTAETKVIWTRHPHGPMGAHIWAPEIHFLAGKWYVYFSAGAAEHPWDIRLYVLENSSLNPLEARGPRRARSR